MQLHFREQGQGPALIILHGLFGSLENWAFVSQQLAQHFRVFTLDLRNHGKSPHAEEMNYDVLAADLREFMQDQNLDQAHVIGHSMGGKAAMRFALSFPESVKRLVVVDMAPRSYSRRHDTIFEALLGLDLSAFQTRAQVDEALEPAIPEMAVRRFLLKGLTQSESGFAWKFNLPVLHQHYSELTRALEPDAVFDHPTLFVRGEKSDYIRDEDEPLIRQMFSRSEVISIADASHWVHAEKPENFVTAVQDFLQKMF